MENNSGNSMVVAIVAIIAVFILAYFGLMFFQNQNTDKEGTTTGVDINLGTDKNPPPPPDAQ